jgi:hypothetical protein
VQKDFVDTERALKKNVTAVVGYAGGVATGPDGQVCYYYADPRYSNLNASLLWKGVQLLMVVGVVG